jgi:monofunctional biosynthetic peptidoglycan transglycosylase
VWILSLFILRIVAPPVTSLVAIRQLQSIWSDYHGVQSWRWAPLRTLPTYVMQAVVTAEDARFMQHWGVDLLAVGDVLDRAGTRKRLRGASTITMQTVKNIFLWPGRSYLRKLLEWMMSPIAGLIWGKRRTLELYLNVIEWGDGIYGIESAARFYFKKPAAQLSVHEAASLAAILPNPRKLSPLRMVQSTRRRFSRIMKEYPSTLVPQR